MESHLQSEMLLQVLRRTTQKREGNREREERNNKRENKRFDITLRIDFFKICSRYKSLKQVGTEILT